MDNLFRKRPFLNEEEISRFVKVSLEVFKKCLVEGKRGIGFYASPPEAKYPFIYTRDFAVVIKALSELGDYRTAKQACDFLLSLQLSSGEWVQRYEAQGKRQDEVVQEDNTPLAVWALLNYVRESNDLELREAMKEKIVRAGQFMVKNTIHPQVYLPVTHTSIHETTVSTGFEIWNACAHAQALELSGTTYSLSEYNRISSLIKRSIVELMVYEERFLRRLDEHGNPDLRPDITTITPYYFGILSALEPTIRNSVRLIERTLEDPILGGYTRYLTYSAEERGCLPGPWFFYTAWMAQYYYDSGQKEKGDTLLRWIFDNSKEYLLPELLLTRERFQRYKEEMKRRAESSPNPLYRESVLKDLNKLESSTEEVLHGVLPLLWSHVETLRALKKGGYIESFALNLQ